jgi:hypothetical protein
MTGGLKEKKIMHSFSRTMNIIFCLTRILLHAHFLAELEVQDEVLLIQLVVMVILYYYNHLTH